MHKNFYQASINTPLGMLVAIAQDEALCFLSFADFAKGEKKIERLKKVNKASMVIGRNKIIDMLEEELNQYFAGTLKEFKVPLSYNGTVFQKHVWQTLKKIPYGQTRSYLNIAYAVGKPAAFRAVANANAANQWVIIVPCHRVINENGGMGGYSSGIERKKWLLEHEKKLLTIK